MSWADGHFWSPPGPGPSPLPWKICKSPYCPPASRLPHLVHSSLQVTSMVRSQCLHTLLRVLTSQIHTSSPILASLSLNHTLLSAVPCAVSHFLGANTSTQPALYFYFTVWKTLTDLLRPAQGPLPHHCPSLHHSRLSVVPE